MRGDAQHRDVVERVEVVLRDAALAARLVVGHLHRLEADFRHQAAKVGVGIVDPAKLLQHLPVVQAEAGEVLDQLDVGNARHGPVVGAADREHQARLVGGRLDPHDQLGTVVPVLDEGLHQLRRVLEIGHQQDRSITACLQQPVVRRADVPEIPCVQDHLDVAIGSGHRAQDLRRSVGREVVDEQMLIRHALDRLEDGARLAVHLLDVLFLVVAGGDDGDVFHEAEKTKRRWSTKAISANGRMTIAFAT
ncbi:hypothetical protein D9M68_660960 [compost metagenome]